MVDEVIVERSVTVNATVQPDTTEAPTPATLFDETVDDTAKTAAAQRIADLEAWLELVKKGDPEIWKNMPLAFVEYGNWQEPDGIRLQENSLTPAQMDCPHGIIKHKRTFATEGEYQAYVAYEKAWGAEHYPPGVEVVPVVTAEGVRTVAIIGLSPQEGNTINAAIFEKMALEKQATLLQVAESPPQTEVSKLERTECLLEPGDIKARVERVVAEMKIENANIPLAGTPDTRETFIPHSPEMHIALQQTIATDTEKSKTHNATLAVIHQRKPRTTTLGRTV